MFPEIHPLPYVSVIVPVRNEEAFLRQTLEQLLRQNYDESHFEILVVDGESTDGTLEIVRTLQTRHFNLVLLHNPQRLSSAARNMGVRHAQGDVIVIIDGHCDLDNEHYLLDLVEAFQRSGADCIGRPQPLDVAKATLLQRAIAAARSSWLGHHPDSWIYSSKERFVRPQSVAVAYRRSVFETVGLFDESFDACEDVEFNHRIELAGLSCFFTPKVRVCYYPRSSLGGLFRQMVRYGRGRVRLLRKHPDTFSVPCFVPMMFLLGLIAGPLLCWLSRPLAGVYVGTLMLYVLLVSLVSIDTSLKCRSPRLLTYLPLVFAAIHVGSGFGTLRELVLGRRSGAQPASLEFSAAEPARPRLNARQPGEVPVLVAATELRKVKN